MAQRTEHQRALWRFFLKLAHLSLVGFLSVVLSSKELTKESAYALCGGNQARSRSSSAVQNSGDARLIEPGKSAEDNLGPGESQFYGVSINSGEFLRVTIKQRSLDALTVTLLGPNGKRLVQADVVYNATEHDILSLESLLGTRCLSFVADASGTYRLALHAPKTALVAAHYELEIEERRMATAQDKTLIAAERATAEGDRFLAQMTGASLRNALEKYTEGLAHW